jgi:threonyl-tRNA synthetase
VQSDRQIEIAGQQVSVPVGASCADALKLALSGKQFKNAVLAKCGESLLDLSAPIPADCAALEPVSADSPEGLSVIRHSTAHLMAEAVKKLFPTAKVTIGPAVENGFYYDFDFERPFTPEDLEAIEAEMVRNVGADKPFTRREMTSAEAREHFAKQGETYKVELIDGVKIVGAATLNDLALDAGATMWF